ncbi:hypothetical protein FOL47_010890 [Perkinsus chesapeaki]|uniref:Uncharacterized protein n=1 Tax=Perkinsus chesapeaki TaxID=330153 RepID=A0A7J6L0M4_PERCH|nr:hypothetical protein FOL47_010890 [Perkinsus chesapeaki]
MFLPNQNQMRADFPVDPQPSCYNTQSFWMEDNDESTTTSSASVAMKSLGLPPASSFQTASNGDMDWSFGTAAAPKTPAQKVPHVIDLCGTPSTDASCLSARSGPSSMSLGDLRVALQASHKRMRALVEEEAAALAAQQSAEEQPLRTPPSKVLCREMVRGSEGGNRLKQWAERSGF